MLKWYKDSKDMSDHETAKRLLVQAENFGTFACLVGSRPFEFIQELGLIDISELVEGDSSSQFSITILRIFDYGKQATAEVGYSATPEGKIQDPSGKKHDPKKFLSTRVASAGWEIGFLVPHFGEIVARWLKEHPDG